MLEKTMAASVSRDKNLIVDSKDSEFKIPSKPAPKKKKVLDEETYTKKVGDIIKRDYFPDLDNLKDKLHFLKATEASDTDILRELYTKYSHGSTPPISRVEDSPATFDTPVQKSAGDTTPLRDKEGQSKNQTDDSGTSKRSVDRNMSLDKFMETYTSEDNESFEEVIAEQHRKFMLKHPWLFEAEIKHNSCYTPNLALPSIEEQHQQKILALTGTADKEKDIRPSSVENWKYKTFNSVMFVPDGASPSKEEILENAKAKMREVRYENTRFTENPFNETLSKATMLEASAIQAYKKEGKVGVDGKELKDSPRVNGYSYVRTPSPAPGVDCSPLMTWGQVEGTPFQLDGSQTPLLKNKNVQGPSYFIPKISDRDELHLRLTEKASQIHKDTKSRALSAAKSSLASPLTRKAQNSSLDRLSSMSPAAQKLFTSKIGISKSTDRALRASYTPSPLTHSSSSLKTPKIKLTPSARQLRNTVTTPSSLAKISSTPMCESVGLTDNLLNLPKRSAASPPEVVGSKRPCAADFF